jgi:hypothetical protein
MKLRLGGAEICGVVGSSHLDETPGVSDILSVMGP